MSDRDERITRGVRAVREGHGANCSSIGSVIDTLFAGAVLGGALFTAIAAALGTEKVRIVGTPTPSPTQPPTQPPSPTPEDDA